MLDPARPVPVGLMREWARALVEIQRQLLGFHAVTLDQGEHSTVEWMQSVLQTLQSCEKQIQGLRQEIETLTDTASSGEY